MPILSSLSMAVVIAVTEGRAIFLGRASMEEALHRGAKRLQESAIFTTLGATLTALDAGVISLPTTVAARTDRARVPYTTDSHR